MRRTPPQIVESKTHASSSDRQPGAHTEERTEQYLRIPYIRNSVFILKLMQSDK